MTTANDANEIKKPSLADLKKSRDDLHKTFGSPGYTEEHFEQLKKIDASIAEFHSSRKDMIKDLKTQIKNNEVTLSELFTKRELGLQGFVPKPD